MSKSGTPGIPVLEVENSPVLWKNPPFLQLSTITPITLAEAMLLDKRYHFIGISVKKMSIFFVMEDFIVMEIISFYIVLQTLNLFKAGSPEIVHFKGEKVAV